MGSKSSSFLCLTILLAFSSAIYAFDVTELLGQYPDLSTFNKYITENKLADEINSRNTITVLTVANGAIASIAGKSPQVIKAIISTHVILDYFDEKKLSEAQGNGQQLTTLYQASGNAVNNQGFLKIALIGEDKIAFGSAVDGAPTDAELVRTVSTEPYNISILQVNKPIIAPGIGSQTPSAEAPVPAQSAKAPVPTQAAKASSPAQAAKAPSPSSSTGAKAPTPSGDGSDAESPTLAPADGPIGVEGPVVAEGPVGDYEGDDEGDAADTFASSSSTTKIGLVEAVMAFASLLIVI
ncbi:hypothetical protein RJT34_16416 [Clitoria ternatea]|uniref:FAS1 domain-containing protein n=1 Tax=Clitoria ternatea TaxID=43366 RepID=A0AAN9J952_CLITE